MAKKFFLAIAILASVNASDIIATAIGEPATFTAAAHAPNDGTYSRTNRSVTIYTESGHCKGSYTIYLHHGNAYIDFNNTWICIQGKRRFGYCGNWYVIK